VNRPAAEVEKEYVELMNYLCLAAGKGSRFGQIGKYLQKAMYPVGIRPFVEYSVLNLLSSGAFSPGTDSLSFVVCHFAEQVKSYFGNSYRGIPVSYVVQEEALGTAHAVRVAHHQLRFTDPAVVWLADTYITPDLFMSVRNEIAPAVLTVKECRGERGDIVPENKNIVVEVENGEVVKSWRGNGDLYDIGLWKLDPEVMNGLGGVSADENRMLLNLQHLIVQGIRVRAIRTQEWIHLGGTEPSVEENIRNVTDRVRELEKGVAHARS
jgi:bifunctional UDP-N-acetylglucosamine pyrophosphorylase/glucosamine-1-phosphate N-acetyltransferase